MALEPPRSTDSRWSAWRWGARGRVAEAAVLLAIAGAAQKWVPMTSWSSVLGRAAEVPREWLGQRVDVMPYIPGSDVEWDVARAVRRASDRLPWTPTCLAQAAAGQVMLRRRNHPGVVVIGLRPRSEKSAAGWEAHAWLLGSQGSLTGGAAASGFTATTVFEVPGALCANEVQLHPISVGDAAAQGR